MSTERADYTYNIELGIDSVLSETEKNQLMIRMSQVLTEVLSKEPKSGTCNI